ncbi:MAG TPA: hypothetical protein VKB75_17795 [Jatrophihabitans sp.]|nr:hypothetical protein [Jatrophihabitans sp.]
MPPLPRVLTVSGARRLGYTDAHVRTELRRGNWQRMASRILLTRPDEATRSDWINAAMVLGGPAAALSGWDAVRLRGLGTARPPSPYVLVLVPTGRNRIVGGVHLRPSHRPAATTLVSALDEHIPSARLAATARAVCDTALLYREFPAVRAMVTAAVQKGICTPSELVAEYEAGPRNGSAHLRRAVLDALAGAHSVAEAEAVQFLRLAGLAGFEVNAPIYDSRGNLVAIVDLLWRQLRAVVEIDSREYHFTEQDWKATTRRHNLLTELDLAVKHYPPSEVRNGRQEWARAVDRWLAGRAQLLGVPYP